MDSKGQGIINKRNPVKTKEVLQTIFEYCSPVTLKNCRLVCKRWKEVSLKAWRNNAALSLCSGEREGGKELSVKGYLRMLEESSANDDNEDALKLRAFPFRKFRIHTDIGFYLKKDIQLITNVAKQVTLYKIERDILDYFSFLGKFNSLEALELFYCDVMDHSSIKRFPASPNLRRLLIHQNDKASNYESNCSLKRLLFCFPNLESLHVEFNHRHIESWEYIEEIIKTMGVMRKQKGDKVMSLKDLEIIDTSNSKKGVCRADTAFLKQIARSKFPLQRLTIDVVWRYREERVIRNITRVLRSCKNTLEYLNIVFKFNFQILDNWNSDTLEFSARTGYPFRPDSDPFPMKQLKTVIFLNGNPWGLYLLAHVKLPKLEKLTFSNDGNGMELKLKVFRISFANGTVFENLKTFEFFETCKIPGPKMVNPLASMMPQLARLTIPLDRSTFKIVCGQLKGLKTLNILAASCHYAELDDETITGIPIQGKGGGKRASEPNITDLTLLSEVNISCEAQLQRRDVKFTDHSVLHGFLHLPLLRSLSIAFKELSDDVKAKLLDHVKGNLEIQKLVAKRFEVEYSAIHIDRKYMERGASQSENDSEESSEGDDDEDSDHEGDHEDGSESSEESESDGPGYSGTSCSSRSGDTDLDDSYSDGEM